MMRINPLLLAILAGAMIYIITLRRQLQASQMRGDMYRDISARLDRRVAELTAK
jgi:preprotein translocase subunit YajC